MMDWRMWAGVGVGAAVLIAAVLTVLKKRRKRKRAGVHLQQSPAIAGHGGSQAIDSSEPAGLAGAETNASRLIGQAQEKITQTARIEVLVDELRTSIDEDPALAASVLRAWIEEAEA